MLIKYLAAFCVAMVPILELRGAVPFATMPVEAGGLGLPYVPALIVCVLGNMLPVPFIYFFARKVLNWGSRQKFIGKVCSFFLRKGESAGRKLTKKAGRYGVIIALMLFVGIPIPGTGAWTGTLGASFINMGFKSTVVAVCIGVVIAGVIMALVSFGLFSFIGL